MNAIFRPGINGFLALCTVVILQGTTGYGQTVEEKIPDRKETQNQIRALVEHYTTQKRKANLGLFREVVTLAIAYGAPTYNLGKREDCLTCYAWATDLLLSTFKDTEKATESGRKALLGFKEAREAARAYTSLDKKAWALRFGFDKLELAWQMRSQQVESLVVLGTNNFQRAQYREAESAFTAALEDIREMEGVDPAALPINASLALFALSHSRYAQEKFTLASEALQEGLRLLPFWPTYEVDQRGFYADEAEHGLLLVKLEAAVKAAPEDAELQFLLGHEYFFGGRRSEAEKPFKKVAELMPQHRFVRLFLRTLPDAPEQKRIEAWVAKLGSEDFAERQEAEKKLEEEGRWALGALRKAASGTQDLEIRASAARIGKKIMGVK